MATLLADNAFGTLGSGLLTSDTTLNFTAGHGARFPAVTGADVLYCCILNASNILEEVIITAHAAAADSCTISRAAGSTTAKAWNAGDRIEARVSSASLKLAIAYWAFPSGTRMPFNQTAAPTGWTKDTTAALNDTAMRIVTGAVGSGGTIAFSAALAAPVVTGSAASYVLQIADIPSHTHPQLYSLSAGAGAGAEAMGASVSGFNTGATGGGGGHTHGAGTLATPINVKYNDFIIASKDA